MEEDKILNNHIDNKLQKNNEQNIFYSNISFNNTQNFKDLKTKETEKISFKNLNIEENVSKELTKYLIERNIDPNLLVWRRLNKIFKAPKLLKSFDFNFEFQDINLTSEIFLSLTLGLSQHSWHIQNLFKTFEINKDGIYTLCLNINGIWKDISISDKIPCLKLETDNYLPLICTNKQEELWPILIEKALATFYQTYFFIKKNDENPLKFFKELLGAPFFELHKEENLKQIWNELKLANNNNWVILAKKKEKNQKHNFDIVLHTYEIKEEEIVTKELIKINELDFNSVKKTKENFASSKNSQNILDKKLRTVQILPKWLRFDSFFEIYEKINICQIDPKYKYSSIKLSMRNKLNIIVFKVKQQNEFYFSVNQPDIIFGKKILGDNWEYGKIRVTLGKLEKNELQYIDCRFSNKRNIFQNCHLFPGFYIFLVETYYPKEIYNNKNSNNNLLSIETFNQEDEENNFYFSLSCYSKNSIDFSLKENPEKYFKKLEYKIWRDFFYLNKDKFLYKNEKKIEEGLNQVILKRYNYDTSKFGIRIEGVYNDCFKSNSVYIIWKIKKLIGADLITQGKNKTLY